MSRSRNYCFTDYQDLDASIIWDNYSDKLRYIVIGNEICPKTGRPHGQGFIQFHKPQRRTAVAKILGKCAFFACKGSALQNVKYCTKDGKYQEFGEAVLQGQRTDLMKIKDEIDNGASLEKLYSDHFETVCRYRNGIKEYKKIIDHKRNKQFRHVETHVYAGPTGVGKTRKAFEENPNAFLLTGDRLQWFDGYEGEKTLIIDEYDNQIKITELLNLLDGYPLRLPIKGSFTYAGWTKVIITTNLTSRQMHVHAKPAHREALKRRITTWTDMAQSAGVI